MTKFANIKLKVVKLPNVTLEGGMPGHTFEIHGWKIVKVRNGAWDKETATKRAKEFRRYFDNFKREVESGTRRREHIMKITFLDEKGAEHTVGDLFYDKATREDRKQISF